MAGKLDDSEHYAALIAESNRRAEQSAQREHWDDADARWHIVNVVSGTERATGEHLKRFKFPFYYPITRVLKRVPRKELSANQRKAGSVVRRPKDEALFKGYMFVHFNINSGLWHDVFRMRNVRGMVYNNDAPAEVPDDLIARIKAREVQGFVPGETRMEDVLGFALGDRVIVDDGPFRGFSGIVDRLPTALTPGCTVEELDESMRCGILVAIFGRDTPVNLAISQFSKR